MVVLFGHGTFDGKAAKFNLPGPDMTPADFAPLLAGLHSKRVVFGNTTSAGGPFVEALAGSAGQRRSVCRGPESRLDSRTDRSRDRAAEGSLRRTRSARGPRRVAQAA